MQEAHLCETYRLDYSTGSLCELVAERGWLTLPEFERVGTIYNYVRDEIAFGYNDEDAIPASRVLRLRRGGI